MDAQSVDFGFVGDEKVRLVLEDYHSQAAKAFEASSYLGAIVAFGAVVEGLLTWALLQREPEALKSSKAGKDKQGKARPLQEWSLTNLIEVCVELDMIGKTASQASWALKDFRNFIHPYNVLKQSARPDQALATGAAAALTEIRRSLKGKISQ
jgi:hypothetical protein